MPGILDQNDPNTQGLLAAAFAMLKASGPSATPVSLGQVLGAGGEAGMASYDKGRMLAADLAAKDVALRKAKLDLSLQESLQGGPQGQGILAGGMNDPDTMEAVGTRLALSGHPGGAALVNAAQKVREKRAAQRQMAAMKSAEGVAPDPQELAQAADQGTPVPQSTRQGGIFSGLTSSPYVGAEAKALQAQLDKAPDTSTDAEQWLKHYERLRQAHSERESKADSLTPAAHVVKDPSSSTGWSYKDLRTGGIVSKDAPAPASAVQQQAAASWTPESIEQAAQRYRVDGSLPPAGFGASGNLVRAKIINRASEMAKADGQTGESERIRQAGFKANTQALGQLEKQRNLVLAFEKNALANADIALQQSEKVDRVGSPAIDRWIQAGKKEVQGDVEVAKLHAAIRTFVNEYAKVTTSVTGGGVTSDTARREIDDLLRSAMTKEQVRGVINLMKQEMKNRETSYAQQVAELKGSMALPSIQKQPGTPPSKQQIDDLLSKYGRKNG